MFYYPTSLILLGYLYILYREVVTDLIEEYKAAERADYVTYGGNMGMAPAPMPPAQTAATDSRMSSPMAAAAEAYMG